MSADGTARLWGTQVPALRQLGAHNGAVSAVAYDPTGKLVLSASADGTARLWHTDGTVAQTLDSGRQGHGRGVRRRERADRG